MIPDDTTPTPEPTTVTESTPELTTPEETAPAQPTDPLPETPALHVVPEEDPSPSDSQTEPTPPKGDPKKSPAELFADEQRPRTAFIVAVMADGRVAVIPDPDLGFAEPLPPATRSDIRHAASDLLADIAAAHTAQIVVGELSQKLPRMLVAMDDIKRRQALMSGGGPLPTIDPRGYKR